MNKETLALFCDRLNSSTFCASRYSCEDTCPLVKMTNICTAMSTGLTFNEAWETLEEKDEPQR